MSGTRARPAWRPPTTTSPSRWIAASPISTRCAFASTGCRPSPPVSHGLRPLSAETASSARFRRCSFTPRPARETLLFLARFQGREHDEERDEEPGKILHEYRRGEMARTREIPHRPYYGSIDATPLFLVLADEYVNFTNDIELVTQLGPVHRGSLSLRARSMRRRSARSTHLRASATAAACATKAGKTARTASAFPMVDLASGPIALVEVQGYAVDGLERAARLLVAHRQDDSRRSPAPDARLRFAKRSTPCTSTNRARARLRSTAMACRS